jgi:tetratricopeptide (TPR) repeat protein
MNSTDYVSLIIKPDVMHHEKQIEALEKVIAEFPYFQSARAIQLKGLYSQNSFKYNTALKNTAAHSADRSVLFDFITSDTFTSIDKISPDQKALTILEIDVVDSTTIGIEQKSQPQVNSIEQSIITSIKEAAASEFTEPLKTIEEKLEIGEPLHFLQREQHSFQEWLQLSRSKPIERENTPEDNDLIDLVEEEKRKKTELIDKFIETSPKISAVKHGTTSTVSFDINANDNSNLMTETLARVYLEQKKYQKAIQAYEILILKYPEKSSFFADRISDIKILQHNNN